MLRANNQTIIGTQGCVYQHPTLRNLDRTNYCLDSMVNRPQSDVNRGVSVGIACMSAFTFEQSPGSSVALADTSTLVADSAGVSWVNFNNLNLFSDSYAFDGREQLEVGYSVDLSVGFLVELAPPGPAILQLLDGDATVELLCQSDYLPSCLEALGLGEIGFVGFQLSQALSAPMRTLVSDALQFASSFIDTPLFVTDFPSHIELPEYPAILDNRYGCKVRRTHIHTEDTLPSNWFWKVFLENGLDNPRAILFKEYDGLEVPPIFEEGTEPLPPTILSDWQGEPFAFNQGDSEYLSLIHI